MVSNSGEIGAGKITGEVLEIITKIHSSIATMIQSSSATAAASAATSGTVVHQQQSSSASTAVGIENRKRNFKHILQF